MDSETQGKERRDPNPEGFQRLLVRLDPDSARASEKYAQLRGRLIRYCFRHDEALRAEELADSAIDEIAKKHDLECIRDVEQFAVGVLRMLLLAHKRKSPQPLCEDPDSIAGAVDFEHSIVSRLDRERKELCFVTCMKRLTPGERQLVFEYYPNEHRDLEGRRKQLAMRIGIQAGTLATRMNRLRSRLERCCVNCYRRSTFGSSLPAGQAIK
jgi:DNA-directed RNA polymerase specialized sigma24 family protein